MTEHENTPVVEYSINFQDRVLSTANIFLDSPEAVSIKDAEWMNTDLEQTISKTVDSASNTAFHVESCAVSGLGPGAKMTEISWLTLGDDKGDLPSGSIKIIEDGKKRQIVAYKHDRNLFTDQGYVWGGSRDLVDRTSSLAIGDNRIPLSEEQAFHILTRLESSQANKEQTEATARLMDSENRFSEALVEFQNAQSTRGFNRLLRYGPARKKLVDAAIKYKEIDDDIDEKRKKQLEKAKKNQAQQVDAS